jgi:glycosyltransferase 2 family protein
MSRRLRTAVGVLLSLLLLGWALRDVSLAEVMRQIRDADVLLLSASIAVALAGFYIRAVRWGILLIPVAPGIPLRPRIAATFIGFAANNLLPARIGEFARAFTLSRLTGVKVGSAFATLVIERLLDGLILVALLFAAMAAPGFPADLQIGGVNLRTAAGGIALLMVGVALFLFLAVMRPRYAAQLAHLLVRILPVRARHPIVQLLRSFAAGLAVLRSTRLFVASVGIAVGQWLFLAVSFVLAFAAFGIDHVPFSGAVFLQSLIGLAVAIPSSPGFFGPYEAASRIGLAFWDVPSDQAISFAIGFHIAGFLPVTLIGVYYVWRLGLRWSEVRESEEAVETRSVDALNPTNADPASRG